MGNMVSSTYEYFFGTPRDTSTGKSSETSTRHSTGDSSETSTRHSTGDSSETSTLHSTGDSSETSTLHSTGDSSRFSNDNTGDTSTRRSSNYTTSYPSSIYRETTTYPTNPFNIYRETTTYQTNPSNSYVRETTNYPTNSRRCPSSRFGTPEYWEKYFPKVVFYHYTDSWGVRAIENSGYIRESTEDSLYAHFGRGVYGTSMAPSAGKLAIAENNWTRGGRANMRNGRADYAIRLEIPKSKVETCPDRNRDLLLHKGQINLSDYNWSVVSVPDNIFDDFY